MKHIAKSSLMSALPGACELQFGGEQIFLLAERAVWWPRGNSLFIADLHLGKDAAFRAAGIPLPHVFTRDLAKLDQLVAKLNPKHLIVLGDLLHARRGPGSAVLEAVAAWRTRNSQLEMLLVRGNHDRQAGDPPPSWQFRCLDAPNLFGPWYLVHAPTFAEPHPTLSGHLHPKYRICHGSEELRLPCFIRRNNTLVLPAFTEFVDHGFVSPRPRDSIFVVAEMDVIEIPPSA